MEKLSARELSKLLKNRAVSAEEVTLATLARAYAVNAETNAFITIADIEAVDTAKALDALGDRSGALFGMPVSLKDTEPTKGIRTTFGSALFRGNVPAQDSAIAANLKRAGTVIFAKTNTPAFGHIDTTENLVGPPARHPFNATLSPGGSSGGAAVAIATGVGTIAQGTDGAGSVRIPASLCGIVGFKPSLGRIPHWPVADLWAARTHQGVLARTVDDVAFAMGAFAQPCAQDPLSTPEPVAWSAERNLSELKALKGLYLPHFGADRTAHEVEALCANAIAQLGAVGLRIDAGHIEVGDIHDWYCDLWQPPLAHQLMRSRRETPELLEPSIHTILNRADSIDLNRHLDARERRSSFHTEMLDAFADADYLVMPTLPSVKWPLGEIPLVGDGKPAAHGASGSRWERMFVFNILGWPAISVPCGTTSEGLPVGLQIVTKKWADRLCLHIAALVEMTSSKSERNTGAAQ